MKSDRKILLVDIDFASSMAHGHTIVTSVHSRNGCTLVRLSETVFLIV